MEKKYFWIFITTIWIVYFFVNFITKWSAGFTQFTWILGMVITSVSGYIVTIFLFKFYQTKQQIELPILNIFLLITISSFISAAVWAIIDPVLSLPLWGIEVFPLIIKDFFTIPSLVIFLMHILLFFSISAVFWGRYLVEYMVSQKIKTERAVLSAENFRLKFLSVQLNPHFLFNSLSSLRSLIREDQKRADKMLTKISDFLRYSLINKKDIHVPLSEEIAAIKNYMEIEKVRYGDNLVAQFEIDPLSEDYPILAFLLQPLIENAVKHGMDTSPMPLKVDVKSGINNGRLSLIISNTGTWVERDTIFGENGTGNGLMIVKERLKHLYADNHNFEINKQNRKVSVLIELLNESREGNADEIQSNYS